LRLPTAAANSLEVKAKSYADRRLVRSSKSDLHHISQARVIVEESNQQFQRYKGRKSKSKSALVEIRHAAAETKTERIMSKKSNSAEYDSGLRIAYGIMRKQWSGLKRQGKPDQTRRRHHHYSMAKL
jgi:Na+-translocating ferredoxin:NAD+ oxidoreductase RnfC subunit